MLPFGQTLLLWRFQRGLTQQDLAAKARIPRTALSAMERGRREVTLKTLRALAVGLSIRPGLLADGTPPHSETIPRSFSRQALERVADRIVYGTPLRDPKEERMAALMSAMVASRALAAGYRVKPIKGKRARQAAWLALSSQVPSQVIRSLLQRIADRERTL